LIVEATVARTRLSATIEVLENTISHLVAADISYRMIAERTDDPHISNEVRNGRRHLAAALRVLVEERNHHKEHPDEEIHHD
jgi:hypothetical protein